MRSLTLESATEERSGVPARKLPRLHVKAFTGGAIVLLFILAGIVGPALAPADPNKQELTAMLKAFRSKRMVGDVIKSAVFIFFSHDLSNAHEITRDDWERRPWHRRLRARVVTPLWPLV